MDCGLVGDEGSNSALAFTIAKSEETMVNDKRHRQRNTKSKSKDKITKQATKRDKIITQTTEDRKKTK